MSPSPTEAPLTDAELVRLTDHLATELVLPPHPGDGVCPICRTWRDDGHPWCGNCVQHADQLGEAPVPVLPITLYRKPSEAREWVTNYKNRDDENAATYSVNVASIVERFFKENHSRLQAGVGGFDAVCMVPPTTNPLPGPLVIALDALPSWHLGPVIQLLRRGPGELGKRRASPDAFVADESAVAGKSLVLLDDVYTSGSTAQSCGTAIRAAGGDPKAIVVVGRRINPDYSPLALSLWERQRAMPFAYDQVLSW